MDIENLDLDDVSRLLDTLTSAMQERERALALLRKMLDDRYEKVFMQYKIVKKKRRVKSFKH